MHDMLRLVVGDERRCGVSVEQEKNGQSVCTRRIRRKVVGHKEVGEGVVANEECERERESASVAVVVVVVVDKGARKKQA